ncbi:hypothetical protein WJ0W_007114 [Paenibacillus melissococcoides]|uniref:Uncharacterized protein n=1 Tax=Paenibacillus melissococcoides TaxID=2912268 RepID=A0ABM9G8W7_9BACL|nr:hypothetical protein [Paenibacillus melissococcoides]CAH8248446.1 hypothetical protein WJ0W_007114 [Paenibacillus melissococcoides]CAH8722067.1 hypothetical protein HTL2_006676 [Paenibacillus melissococcoides]CAH8722091.1 hypothetical protein WDD9_006615 [Paenibacillus melissococcoides]
MKTLMVKAARKMHEVQTKACLVLTNQRGDATSTSQVGWIVIGVAAVVVIWGFISGWLPELLNGVKAKVMTILG